MDIFDYKLDISEGKNQQTEGNFSHSSGPRRISFSRTLRAKPIHILSIVF